MPPVVAVDVNGAVEFGDGNRAFAILERVVGRRVVVAISSCGIGFAVGERRWRMGSASGIGERVRRQICVTDPFDGFGQLAFGFHELLHGEPGFWKGNEKTDREWRVVKTLDEFTEAGHVALGCVSVIEHFCASLFIDDENAVVWISPQT